MVSVLMPVFNGEKYLKESISSVLENEFRKFEFIIVNDGSTDNTEKIIRSFKDGRIKYFKKLNSGISESLNYGISKCSYNLIARIDSDDVMHSKRLIKQLEYFKKHQIDVLGSNAILIDSEGLKINNTTFPLDHKTIKKKTRKL